MAIVVLGSSLRPTPSADQQIPDGHLQDFVDYGVSNITAEAVTRAAFRYPDGISEAPKASEDAVAPVRSKPPLMRALAISDAVAFGLAWALLLYSSTFFTRYLARQAQRDSITLATYSVSVTGLPNDASADEVRHDSYRTPAEYSRPLSFHQNVVSMLCPRNRWNNSAF